MIEAEVKARGAEPAVLRARLRELAEEEVSVYRDTYYDRPDGALTAEGRELRVRIIETKGHRRSVLTYKEPVVDEASGSKPEHETEIADPDVIDTALRALDARRLVSFAKHCANFRFNAAGRNMLA